MSAKHIPQLAVFLSGGGRTMVNIHDRILDGTLEAQIAIVVAPKPCIGIDRAAERGLETLIAPGPITPQDVSQLLEHHKIDLVILAGYLKLFPMVPKYEGRVLNIHPALLPKFGGKGMYGHLVHEAVIKSGDQISGCTVHLCDAEYDRGEILVQRTCAVMPTDTPESLAAKVFEQELIAYPEAIQLMLERLDPQRMPES